MLPEAHPPRGLWNPSRWLMPPRRMRSLGTQRGLRGWVGGGAGDERQQRDERPPRPAPSVRPAHPRPAPPLAAHRVSAAPPPRPSPAGSLSLWADSDGPLMGLKTGPTGRIRVALAPDPSPSGIFLPTAYLTNVSVWNYPTRSRDGASSSDDNSDTGPDHADRDRGATPPRTSAGMSERSPCAVTQARRPLFMSSRT